MQRIINKFENLFNFIDITHMFIDITKIYDQQVVTMLSSTSDELG